MGSPLLPALVLSGAQVQLDRPHRLNPFSQSHRALWPFLHPEDTSAFHTALSAAVLQAPGQRVSCRLRSPHHTSGYLSVDASLRYGRQGVVLFLRPEAGTLSGLVGGAPAVLAQHHHSQLGALQQMPYQQQQQQQQEGAVGPAPCGSMAPPLLQPVVGVAPSYPYPIFASAPPPPSPVPSSSSSMSSHAGPPSFPRTAP